MRAGEYCPICVISLMLLEETNACIILVTAEAAAIADGRPIEICG